MLTNLGALEATLESPPEDMPYPILKFRRPNDSTPIAHSPSRAQRWYLPIRRLLDFSLALVLTLLAIPVVVLAALVVRLTSRGPAFYTQTRTGKGGATFTIFKIRTMLHNCESLTGPRW